MPCRDWKTNRLQSRGFVDASVRIPLFLTENQTKIPKSDPLLKSNFGLANQYAVQVSYLDSYLRF